MATMKASEQRYAVQRLKEIVDRHQPTGRESLLAEAKKTKEWKAIKKLNDKIEELDTKRKALAKEFRFENGAGNVVKVNWHGDIYVDTINNHESRYDCIQKEIDSIMLGDSATALKMIADVETRFKDK